MKPSPDYGDLRGRKNRSGRKEVSKVGDYKGKKRQGESRGLKMWVKLGTKKPLTISGTVAMEQSPNFSTYMNEEMICNSSTLTAHLCNLYTHAAIMGLFSSVYQRQEGKSVS